MMDNAMNRRSDFARDIDFEDIRTCYDHEVKDLTQRLISDPMFMPLVNYLWPDMTFEEVKEKAGRINSNIDFQLEFMHGAIRRILEMSSSGLSSSGFGQLDPEKSYLFVGNHRDILLDAAILQVLLVENRLSTSEITFGSNLQEQGFITNFGRLNRMFTIQRDGKSKRLYEISKKLSAYIRHTLVDKKVSVWIAQRNGRTKDGNDLTQTGLLKMLNISGSGSFSENFSQLNIIPLSISYEYEPCDLLKTQEIYLSGLHENYQKAKGEDLNSLITGIQQFKGKIHLCAGRPVDAEEYRYIDSFRNENDKFRILTKMIDQRIRSDYRLNTTNYIACDLYHKTSRFSALYSTEEKNAFIQYTEKQIGQIQGDQSILKDIFLKIYAQPVINKETTEADPFSLRKSAGAVMT